MTAAADPRSSICWRTLVDSPLLLGSWAAIVLGCIAICEVAGAVRRAEVVRRAAAQAMARVAAEAAAVQFVGSVDPCGREQVSIGDVRVELRERGDECWIMAEAGGERFRFRCEQLAGAAPEMFGYACSSPDPAPASIVARTVLRAAPPALDEVVVARAVRADRSSAFVRDNGIALLAWETGTERDDYVFAPDALARGVDEPGRVVVVPGNLWVEVGDRPQRLIMRHDLTVVVHGNVYLGRSLHVDGPGRLVIVAATTRCAVAFADVDANGRWSGADRLLAAERFKGPFEGAGNVYLGLPRARAPLRVDAALVVAGELHLGAAATVGGPLSLGHGVTRLVATGAKLEARGDWTFCVQRERVPGFATSGQPRPGLLRPAEPEAN